MSRVTSMTNQRIDFIDMRDFGMDTITLAGTLPAKLTAIRAAGFSQVMLMARDLVGHAEGVDDAVRIVKASGLRVTGFQVLRDFEGLTGHLHDYKIDIAKSMLELGHAVGAKLLLVCSSTSTHASGDPDALARDLRKLAMLAVPLGIRIAYEGLSWGRHVNEFPSAWDIVCRADAPNLGIGIDSFHAFHVERGAVVRGTHRHRTSLSRPPRRRRAQRAARRTGAAARPAGLPR